MENKFELPPASAEHDPNYDGVIAAPNSHEVVHDGDTRRDMKVRLNPGQREPYHHHHLPSTMYVLKSALLRYYHADGSFIDLPKREDVSSLNPYVEELGPEPIHSVENLSETDVFFALRIERKI